MAEAYDPGNIFAKILRGEIPSHRVYEDDAVVAFMDVMPQGTGHTLVVPKAPSRNMLDADPATVLVHRRGLDVTWRQATDLEAAIVEAAFAGQSLAALGERMTLDADRAAELLLSFRRLVEEGFFAPPAQPAIARQEAS